MSQDTENAAVKRALESSYCPEPIHEAREAQDKILRARYRAGPYRIADIGCGNGYHAVMFAPFLEQYHGFEISQAMADTARELWRAEGMERAEIFVGDVAEAQLENEYYDLVLCMYFTPGNIRDKFDDLSRYTNAYLDRNPMFIRVVSRFLRAMRGDGHMLFTIYKDVLKAEAAQVDFYKKTAQEVVTPPGSRFVATAEGFWSARWTKASMLSNLEGAGVRPENVTFEDLNDIAWLVTVTKPA